jgi:hypothetical protein
MGLIPEMMCEYNSLFVHLQHAVAYYHSYSALFRFIDVFALISMIHAHNFREYVFVIRADFLRSMHCVLAL